MNTMTAADVVIATMAPHELIGIQHGSNLCLCGTTCTSWLEHLGDVALTMYGLNWPVVGRKPSELTEPDPTAQDIRNARAVLYQMRIDQLALGRRADELGLIDFIDRSDWLLANDPDRPAPQIWEDAA